MAFRDFLANPKGMFIARVLRNLHERFICGKVIIKFAGS